MGRNRNKSKNSGRGGSGRDPKPTPAPAPSAEVKIAAAHGRAFEVATEADLEHVESKPEPVTRDAATLWEQVNEAEQLFKAAATRLDEERQRLDDRVAALVRREQDVDERARGLDDREAAVSSAESASAAREKEAAALEKKASTRELALDARERNVREAEAEAEAGFAARSREATRELVDQVRALADKHDALQRRNAELATAQAAASAEVWENARKDAETTIEAERSRLRGELDELVLARQDAARIRQELGWEREELRGERELLATRAEQLAAGKLAEKDGVIAVLDAKNKELTRQRDDLDRQVREQAERSRCFGHRTDEEVERLIQDLQARVTELDAELARRPSSQSIDEVNALRAERDKLEADLSRTRRELEALRVQLTRTETGVTELEALRDQCQSFKKSNEILHASNEQLRRDIDARIRSADGGSPFPACMEIDREQKLQGRRPVLDEVDLKELVAVVRDGAACAQTPLYYTNEDIRAFLGGMAMSRLALLQGPSGTGKTSLPFAFAKAMGTVVELVPAEAGWHDPADLIGHFNQFERRFDERPFLKALYRAGTPYFSSVPVFVVVDEMNLSHPEQYFSNVISMLEADRHEKQRFELLPVAADSPPGQFEDGRFLPLPSNVWFVGTANHDETTKDFADKTYDRAVVMELPIRPVSFAADAPAGLGEPVGVEALEAAFRKAEKSNAKQADQALRFLDEHLKEPLARRFRTGWSPRLDRQARRFIPAVIAAGGTTVEAVDHLVAMRILRKIRDRHATRKDDLDVLRDVLDLRWKEGMGRHLPRRCLHLLDEEQRRIERDLA